jgi:lysophospholipase L1-like esterase
LAVGTIVKGEYHANKQTLILTKRQIPYDFFPTNLQIISVGDSLTKGVGDSTKSGGYIPYLEEQLEDYKGISDVEFQNFGIRGNRTDDLLKRLGTADLQDAIKKSDLLILTVGGNDIMKVVRENIGHLDKKDFEPAKKQFEKNLYLIFKTIRKVQPHIPIVLVGLYNPFYAWFADIKEMEEILYDWNSAAKKVVSNYRTTYFVNIDEIFKGTTKNLLHSDYFHPNDYGYSLIASHLYETLVQSAIKDMFKSSEPLVTRRILNASD